MTRASTQQAMDALSTPAIEATFDRIDALLTQLLEHVKAFDFKISLALTHHSSCPAVLDPCDATDDTEISDGPHFFVCGDSLLPHNGVDDIPGGLLVSAGALMPPASPQPLNDVMDPKGEGSVVIEMGLAGIHKCMPPVAHMGLLSDATPVAEILVQSLVSVYGDSFKIEALGGFAPFVAHESKGLHALHLFVEMQHSGALCHGNAILGVDLSYYMGIRDKGGGFEVLQKELQHKGFIKNGVQDYGCVDDFELFSHMGHRDKRGSFIGWIWRTDLRWFRYKITHISSFSCMNNSAYGKEEVDDAIRLMICIGRCKWGLLSSITCCSYNIWLSFEFHSPGQHNRLIGHMGANLVCTYTGYFIININKLGKLVDWPLDHNNFSYGKHNMFPCGEQTYQFASEAMTKKLDVSLSHLLTKTDYEAAKDWSRDYVAAQDGSRDYEAAYGIVHCGQCGVVFSSTVNELVNRNNAAATDVLVHWQHHSKEDATGEDYNSLTSRFPDFKP